MKTKRNGRNGAGRMMGMILGGVVATTALGRAESFAFKDGDRIALVGNTVIERMQEFGQVEALLSLGAGEKVKGLSFRNLGWSGDSVFGDARSYFGPPQEGRDRLARVIGEVKPTVLLVCYGTNAAMTATVGWTDEGAVAARSKGGDAESLKLFLEGYAALLDLMKGSAGEGLREIVLISPPPLENLGAPWPDQSENNQRLAMYRDAIRSLAESRGHRFLDLFGLMGKDRLQPGVESPGPLTMNGVHYEEAGYTVMGEALVRGLGLKLPENLSGNAAEVVALGQTIKAKNRLFFHRWRPVNETYLFLFRKHEQGQNAKEIPMFDPLIAAEEAKIEALRAKVFEQLKKG